MDNESTVRAKIHSAQQGAAFLHAANTERVVLGLTKMALAMGREMPGYERLCKELTLSTGLSLPMVQWALQTSVAPYAHRESYAPLGRAYEITAQKEALSFVGLSTVVLSANVFSAAFRALVTGLIARSPLIFKASSRDDGFVRWLCTTLQTVDPELGACAQVVTFQGGDAALEALLFEASDCVHVYGSASSIEDVSARLPKRVEFAPHGPGCGVGYVHHSALEAPGALANLASKCALDVAAYDQLGCLSPHAIWVETQEPSDALKFAEALSLALGDLEKALPRGAVSANALALCHAWKGVAKSRGELFEGPTHAVSFEPGGLWRSSAGYRHVAVFAGADPKEMWDVVMPLGEMLKTLGVSPIEIGARWQVPMQSLGAPRICTLGAMQTPPLDEQWDGKNLLAQYMRNMLLV